MVIGLGLLGMYGGCERNVTVDTPRADTHMTWPLMVVLSCPDHSYVEA